LQDSDACIICDQAAETMDHLILSCVFNHELWDSCLQSFLLHDLVVIEQEDIMWWWTTSRKRLSKELHRGFDSFLLLVGWLPVEGKKR